MVLLERSHRLCLKRMQEIGRYTRTYAALSLTGSLSVLFEIDKRKTLLFGQLCRLEPHSVVKRLFMIRLIDHYLYNKLKAGFIVDVFRILKRYVLSEFITSGTFQSRHSWKKLVRSKIAEASVRNFESVNVEDALYRFRSVHPETKPCYFWELSRKHPNMLPACKSEVQLIALTFSVYHPIVTCSACGSIVTKYVDHCILWCPANTECGLGSGINLESICTFA